jgi:hypothetical protein
VKRTSDAPDRLDFVEQAPSCIVLEEHGAMITIHHLPFSQSHRIVWLCEELELPYRLDLYEREPMHSGLSLAADASARQGAAKRHRGGPL